MSQSALRVSAIPSAAMRWISRRIGDAGSLKAVLQLDPECPAILIDDILHVLTRAGIPIFLIHEVIDMSGQLPPFDDPLTEERHVQNVKGTGAVSGEREA